MTNSSSNRPPALTAPGTPARGAAVHARFIPREELRDFAAWTPGSFGSTDPLQSLRGTEPTPPAPGAVSEPQWHERVAEARRQGSQDGYRNGYRDGLVALEGFKQSFASQTTAQVGALLAAMQREFEALQPQLAEGVARAALELARQVLRHEISTHPEVIRGVAEQALQSLVHSARHVQLQVHPLDVPLVREGAAEILAARHAQVVPNAALQRGDCVIESDIGTLDARLATRWAQATANLAASAPWTATAEPEPAA